MEEEYSLITEKNDFDFLSDEVRVMMYHNSDMVGYIDFEVIFVDDDLLGESVSREMTYKMTKGNEKFIFISILKINREYRSMGYGNIFLKKFLNYYVPTHYPQLNTVVLYPDVLDNNLGLKSEQYREVIFRFYKRNGLKFIPRCKLKYMFADI